MTAPPLRSAALVPPFTVARREAWGIALLMVAAAVALRWPMFGSPLAGLDEQFYLLVGDRMLHGALPYVDIWDRKPLGLFLIYAAIRLLPGDGILAYQTVSTVALAATGWIVAMIARRRLGPAQGAAAGLIVIVYSVLMGSGFGEAPIFHDVLTALAAWCVLRQCDDVHAPRASLFGFGAMLLCGVAITIKPVAAFEGAALGMMSIATGSDRSWPARARLATAYALAGLGPTIAIAGYYASRGAFDAFWFANFTSVSLRSGGTGPQSGVQLIATLLTLSPLIGLAAIALRPWSGSPNSDRILLLIWLAGATIGFLSVGFFHFHYALPMLAPLAILAVGALRRRWEWGAGLALAAVVITLVATGNRDTAARDRNAVRALLAALPADVDTRCLLVLEGPTIVYHLSHACLASPYAFPGHFASPDEALALGRPRKLILAEALNRKPAAIMTTWPISDPQLRVALAAYSPSRPIAVRLYGSTRVPIIVWCLRSA